MNIRERVFAGRHIKLQGLLFAIVAFCLTVFIYGFLKYPDAPYRLCDGGDYCGKTGRRYTDVKYREWKSWEKFLFVCWPFGLLASYFFSKLRKRRD